MSKTAWANSSARRHGQSKCTASSPVKPAKHVGIASGGLQPRGHSTNHISVLYDEAEQIQRKLALQESSIALAERATGILREQQDPEVLDLRPYITELNDALLNELANHLEANGKLLTKHHVDKKDVARAFYSTVVLSGCKRVTAVGMRSFIHIMGPRIRRLDLSQSVVPIDVLKVMATAIDRLDALDFSWCPLLVAESIHEFISCCNRSLTKLNLSHCPMLNDDALGWIAGVLGPQGSLTQCCKLLSLDLSYTACITDRGLAHLGTGCRSIQFLNLEGMERISNTGILRVVEGCKNLRVLSLKKCMQLTDASLIYIGRHASNLRSVNLCACYNMSSKGFLAMVTGTPQIQLIDLEGCRYMKEDILAVVATKCLSLQALNVNGCQEITENGLATLAEHLPYVMKARQYRGLEPKTNALQLKFSTQHKTIHNSAALRIQSVYRGHVGRRVASRWRVERVETPAVNRIRRGYHCYRLRKEINQRSVETKVQRESAVQIQGLVRGVLCRAALARQAEKHKRLVVWGAAAVKIQAVYRSHWTRRNLPLVFKTIQRYHREQCLQRRLAAAILLQRAFRKRYNRSRFDDVLAIQRRRRQERHKAATLLQRLYRTRAARKAYRMLLEAVAKQQEIVQQLVKHAIKLQSQWRGHRGRREIVKAREEYVKREQRKYNAASQINAGVRGYLARRLAQRERVIRTTRTRAVKVIQRQWRLHKTASPERIQFDKMLAKVKEQVLEESLLALKKQDEVLKKARALVDRDSASEPENDDDWQDFQDENGFPFWFSPSRNQRLYVRPHENAHEKSLLGMACRLFWPLEQRWFNGRVTKYNHAKHKHRILYDDGDHEWINVARESDRVQLFNGYCWCMARMFEPAMRTLKATVFLSLRVQHYDHRYMGWRTGTILGFNEHTDAFLISYDEDTSTGAQQEEVDLFRLEHAVQVQDARTSQWTSLSGYVFGAALGRPVGPLKQSEAGYYYSVEDYLSYVEPLAEEAVPDKVVEEEDEATAFQVDDHPQDSGDPGPDLDRDADDEEDDDEDENDGSEDEGDDDEEEEDDDEDDGADDEAEDDDDEAEGEDDE